MSLRGNFPIGLFLLFIYFLLFPRHINKEILIKATSLVPLSSSKPDSNSSNSLQDDIMVLNSGEYLAYLDNKLNVRFYYPERYNAASDTWLVNVEERIIHLNRPDNSSIAKIRKKGFPIERNGQLYIYNYLSGSISMIDTQKGSILWEREYISPVTVLDYRENLSLIGFLNGRIVLIDNSGSTISEYASSGSQIKVVYGAAISQDASKIALLSGLEPQRFVLLKKVHEGFSLLEEYTSGTKHRHPVKMAFIRMDKEIIYENTDYNSILKLSNLKTESVGMSGKLMAWLDQFPGNVLIIASDGANPRSQDGTMLHREKALQALTKNNNMFFRTALPQDTLKILRKDEKLIVLLKSGIAIMDLYIQ